MKIKIKFSTIHIQNNNKWDWQANDLQEEENQ